MPPQKTALQQINEKDVSDMDDVEFCIWRWVSGGSIAAEAADLRAGWLAEIERLNAEVDSLRKIEEYSEEFYNEVRRQVLLRTNANFTRANQIWKEREREA